jgi:thymidylate synthase (FAD)
LASYSQESTRFCNYGNEKFGSEITVIEPCFWAMPLKFESLATSRGIWEQAMKAAETCYLNLLAAGASAQEARSVLPNSLKTEIICTFNLREWRHFFKLRTGKAAHPQMREITIPMLAKFKELIPILFDDIQAG